jgi:hypothetical protein
MAALHTICQREFMRGKGRLMAQNKVLAATVERFINNVEETGETIRTEA